MKKLDMIVIGPGPAPPTAVIRRKSLCQQLNLKKSQAFAGRCDSERISHCRCSKKMAKLSNIHRRSWSGDT